MRPSKALLIILSALFVSGLMVTGCRLWWQHPNVEILTIAWWSLFAVCALATIIDGLNTGCKSAIHVVRRVSANLSLGVRNAVRLQVTNEAPYTVRFKITDSYPSQVRVGHLPRAVTLPPQGEATVNYELYPMARGNASFGAALLRIESRWRLWEFHQESSEPETVRIFPNFTAIKYFQDLRHEQQLSQLGVHQRQRRGEGSDFRQLREYREGDPLRQVDWKASSRHNRLISREYQDERDQEIVFLLDCGRRMRAKDGELSHFEHALNALLLMSYIALRQGDSVGIMTFAGERRWLPPVKGPGAINTLLNRVYDVHSSTETSDTRQAAEQLIGRHRKRALVILLTNVTVDDRDDLLESTRLLRDKHLVLVASLREEHLDNTVNTPVTSFDSALAYSGAMQLLEQRRLLLKSLRLRDLYLVDTLAKNLHISLVNKYWELKRGGLI